MYVFAFFLGKVFHENITYMKIFIIFLRFQLKNKNLYTDRYLYIMCWCALKVMCICKSNYTLLLLFVSEKFGQLCSTLEKLLVWVEA